MPTERLATFDLGMLYTGVAGLLNVVAIADALGIVEDRVAEADMRRRTAAVEAHLAAEARALAALEAPPPIEAPSASAALPSADGGPAS